MPDVPDSDVTPGSDPLSPVVPNPALSSAAPAPASGTPWPSWPDVVKSDAYRNLSPALSQVIFQKFARDQQRIIDSTPAQTPEDQTILKQTQQRLSQGLQQIATSQFGMGLPLDETGKPLTVGKVAQIYGAVPQPATYVNPTGTEFNATPDLPLLVKQPNAALEAAVSRTPGAQLDPDSATIGGQAMDALNSTLSHVFTAPGNVAGYVADKIFGMEPGTSALDRGIALVEQRQRDAQASRPSGAAGVVSTDIPQAAGGFAATVIGGGGPVLGWKGMAAFAASDTAHTLYNDALNSGATPTQAAESAGVGSVLTALTFKFMEPVANKAAQYAFGDNAENFAKGLYRPTVSEAAKFMAADAAGQASLGGAQQVLQNMADQHLYDPDRPWYQGAADAALQQGFFSLMHLPTLLQSFSGAADKISGTAQAMQAAQAGLDVATKGGDTDEIAKAQTSYDQVKSNFQDLIKQTADKTEAPNTGDALDTKAIVSGEKPIPGTNSLADLNDTLQKEVELPAEGEGVEPSATTDETPKEPAAAEAVQPAPDAATPQGEAVGSGDDAKHEGSAEAESAPVVAGEPESKGTAPATHIGDQEQAGGKPTIPLFNLDEDIPGHPKGSTVSGETLTKAGYDLPDTKDQAPLRSRIMSALGAGAPKTAKIVFSTDEEHPAWAYPNQTGKIFVNPGAMSEAVKTLDDGFKDTAHGDEYIRRLMTQKTGEEIIHNAQHQIRADHDIAAIHDSIPEDERQATIARYGNDSIDATKGTSPEDIANRKTGFVEEHARQILQRKALGETTEDVWIQGNKTGLVRYFQALYQRIKAHIAEFGSSKELSNYLKNIQSVLKDAKKSGHNIPESGVISAASNPKMKTAKSERDKLLPEIEKKLNAEPENNRSAHGKNVEGYYATQPLFEHFEMPDGSQNRFEASKWGSQYLEGEYPDGKKYKLSIRDHDVSPAYERPTKSFMVSQEWKPSEVNSAITKAEDYLKQEWPKHPEENHPDYPTKESIAKDRATADRLELTVKNYPPEHQAEARRTIDNMRREADEDEKKLLGPISGQEITHPNPESLKNSQVTFAAKPKLEKAKELAGDLKSKFLGLKKFGPLERIVNKFNSDEQTKSQIVDRTVKQIQKDVPNQLDDEGMALYIDAKGDTSQLAKWKKIVEQAPKTKENVLYAKRLEAAQNLPQKALDWVNHINTNKALVRASLMKWGVNVGFVDNYITRMWKLDSTGEPIRNIAGRSLKNTFRFAGNRSIENSFEGWRAGLEPAEQRASVLWGHYTNEAMSVINSRKLVASANKEVMPDGKPIVSPNQGSKWVDAENPKGKARLIMKPFSWGQYADYRSLDLPAFSDWYGAGVIDGKSIYLKSDMSIHPEAYEQFHNMFSNSRLSEWFHEPTIDPLGKAAKIATKFVVDDARNWIKGTLLGGFPIFHIQQEATGALGYGVNPVREALKSPIDTNDPRYQYAAEHGTQFFSTSASLHTYMEGFSANNSLLLKALENIPGVKDLGGKYLSDIAKDTTDWTFNHFIPRLKLATFENILARKKVTFAEELKNGTATEDDLAYRASYDTNNAYGHLNYADMGRSATRQHLMNIIALAPDFWEARLRHAFSATAGAASLGMNKANREQFRSFAILGGGMYVAARVLNQMLTGDPHYELENSFRIIDGNRAYGMRCYIADFQEMLTNTRSYFTGRINPVARFVEEGATGVNYRGEKVAASDIWRDLIAQAIPIPLQPFTRGLSTTGINSTVSPMEQFMGACGIKVSRFAPAQQIYPLAKAWNDAQGKPVDKGTFPTSPYTPLKYALEDANFDEAKKQYASLLATNKGNVLKTSEGLIRSINAPFTGSRATDLEFRKSLDAHDQQIYDAAVARRSLLVKRFMEMRSGGG